MPLASVVKAEIDPCPAKTHLRRFHVPPCLRLGYKLFIGSTWFPRWFWAVEGMGPGVTLTLEGLRWKRFTVTAENPYALARRLDPNFRA